MGSGTINPFDAAVVLVTLVAVVTGFGSGLLRSLATIFGYFVAAPVAVAATPPASKLFTELFHLPPTQPWIEFCAVFLAAGLVLSWMCRMAVSELIGPRISVPDRAAGAILGAVRVTLLAVLLVLVFDRIIPAGREPGFLRGSQLRPILSEAGKQGLRTLPPDITEYIDRLKRERGI
jgi:membrane protein required for colicin V production